jgi:Uma2 family endonuclease
VIAQPASPFISPNDYLAAEADSLIKHEYRQGEAYAMAGASNNHVLISVNIASLLRNHLRGSGCRTYAADTKVHIETLNTYYYPDVVVSCDDRDRSFDNFLRYPCLIFEVLSESTEAFDRGDKFADYRHLDSLQEYVLISQNKQRIDRFQRNEQGLWVLSSCEGSYRLLLPTLNFDCAIAEIYEDVNFDAIAT